MTKEKIAVNDFFVEQLTHSAYFIQALRIPPGYSTRLEKLLSVFEQKRFIGNDETTKLFPYENDDSDMKELLGILQYVAADAQTREELDLENYYLKSMEWSFGEQNAKLEKQKQELDKNKKTIAEHINTIAEKDNAIAKLQNDLIATAKKMLQDGISIENISKYTGLSRDEIEQ